MMLPEGVKAVWDVGKAYRETTATRERICINGLWRFKPAAADDEAVPAPGTGWGYFKVPGTWPLGAGRRETGPSQRIYAPEDWPERLGDVEVAWYAREIEVPAQWRGRRIAIHAAWVSSYARVFVDGVKAGDIVFPGGEVEITAACKPGQTQQLAIQVFGRPLNEDKTYFVTPPEDAERRRLIGRRGLCGDVFLTGTSRGARITHVSVDTSVRRWTLTVTAAVEDLDEGRSYTLRARVADQGREVLITESEPFTSEDLAARRFSFTTDWKAPKLWDIHTPENQYDVAVALVEGDTVLDAYYPVRFGFREFWIEGRDFYLNGSRVHLRAPPLNSAQNSTSTASYEGACETMRRLKWGGWNAAYTHNYNCQPGAHIAFEEILRAADDVGVLLSFSLPHRRNYDWEGEEPEKRNGYERDLEWYVGTAQNHPSVVMYSQNHNSTAYADDENPQRIPLVLDCIFPGYLSERLRQVYAREPILRQFDKVRIQYNHSGPSRSMYTMNCYLNWVPMQERSEWFQRWSEYGARPLYVVEYGEPLIFTYGSSRGRRRRGQPGKRRQYQFTEWGAAMRGDAAFDLSEYEAARLRSEALGFSGGDRIAGRTYSVPGGNRLDVPNLRGVQAEFIKGTWPYIRTLGVSGFNIWHEANLFRFREGAEAGRVELEVDWEGLQRPGYSPDFYEPSPNNSMPYAIGTKLEDWGTNIRGAAFRRFNQPLLAYIAGKPERFTARGHNYLPGQVVEKQVIVINDSRETVECTCEWSVDLPKRAAGTSTVRVKPGDNERILVRFQLPERLRPGEFELQLKAAFSTGEVQEDAFALHVLPARKAPRGKGKMALYDPHGQTAKLLAELGLGFDTVQVDADLSGYDLLVVGKKALTVDGAAPDLSGVPDGLKVVMFEQASGVLEQRLGFRVQEFGLRRVFARVPGHPILEGLADGHLRDWHGEATLVPPALPLASYYSYPIVKWCGFDTFRPGRAGNYGNVSSVMIEKPAAGDFLPIVDGGFALQYSPLMLYREGKGMVLFCQVDVTGRTEDDPAARRLAANIVEFADGWSAPAQRSAVYAGEAAGLEHLKASGAAVEAFEGQIPARDQVLVLGPGAAETLAPHAEEIERWIRRGGRTLALALSEDEAQAAMGLAVQMEVREHISCRYAPAGPDSAIAGVGCGEFMIRDPRDVPLLVGGAGVMGNGVLAQAEGTSVVLCQLAPWHFDYEALYNTKGAFRHLSFAVSRLLGNMGVVLKTPLLDHLSRPAEPEETRWLGGLYLDVPELQEDDPYRFYRW